MPTILKIKNKDRFLTRQNAKLQDVKVTHQKDLMMSSQHSPIILQIPLRKVPLYA